jgi:quercetin dioxygenase-like cupin family protein
MKNFLQIASGVETSKILLGVHINSHLWDQNLLRTHHENTPHSQVSDIWVRFNDITKYNNEEEAREVLDEHESINYPAFTEIPALRSVVFGLMAAVEGERLGRVLITKVRPGGRIDPHVDSGNHAAYYDRFHIVLQSGPGCLFRAGQETVHMRPGEVWWFDNQQEHEVVNNSSVDRIHIIVDIRTSRFK